MQFRDLFVLPKYFHAFMNARMKDCGLSSMYFPYIKILSFKQGIPMAELTRQVHFDKSNTSRLVSELCEQGYIRYEAGEDKRQKVLFLSDKGLELAGKIMELEGEWRERLFRGLTQEELIKMQHIMATVLTNAGEALKEQNLDKEAQDD